MYKTQCVLALAALYFGLAHSWDIAVSVQNHLIFFSDDGTITNTVNLISHNPAALAYDEVHNMMLYVDKQSDSDAICGYNLHYKENKCFIKRVGGNIHSIAFDPITNTLFFTDTNERSINWYSLKLGSNKNVNLLIKMDDRTPSDIAVDGCRGYIYWTNTDKKYIETARFNGSDRKVIYESLQVSSIAIDLQTRKIFNFDHGTLLYLDSRDLDGQNERTMIRHLFYSKPKELTVSNDYLYWINSSTSYTTVWQLPKNAMQDVEPKEISKFYTETPLGIAANYKIKDQIQGLQDCEVLWSLISNIGERCDVSVCENYCLQGDCSFDDEGLPKCRCNAGYSGERCEVYACYGYCLNNGTCFLNETDEPVCQCVGNHKGTRCEAAKDDTFTFTSTPTFTAERKPTLADLLSKCLNYCLQGTCSFTDDGPLCRCNAGYSGERCEVYACHGYCLNNGDCSLNEEDEPFCQCVDNYEGIRCETAINYTLTNTPFDSVKRNLTLADILLSWRKPTSKMTLIVEL